jgi:hypothetical protein
VRTIGINTTIRLPESRFSKQEEIVDPNAGRITQNLSIPTTPVETDPTVARPLIIDSVVYEPLENIEASNRPEKPSIRFEENMEVAIAPKHGLRNARVPKTTRRRIPIGFLFPSLSASMDTMESQRSEGSMREYVSTGTDPIDWEDSIETSSPVLYQPRTDEIAPRETGELGPRRDQIPTGRLAPWAKPGSVSQTSKWAVSDEESDVDETQNEQIDLFRNMPPMENIRDAVEHIPNPSRGNYRGRNISGGRHGRFGGRGRQNRQHTRNSQRF